MHYISVKLLVWWRVCTTYLSHHQYGGGCAAQIRLTISTEKGVQDRTTEIAQGVVYDCMFLGNSLLQTILL